MNLRIELYNERYFDQLCQVMDKARMQELKTANIERVFLQLKDAPYLDYLLNCKIYVAIKEEKLIGFVGLRPHELAFLYVDSDFQKQGVGTKLMKTALLYLDKPIKLEVFSDNFVAKSLYKKFGFKVIKTVVEKWSNEYPVNFSQDSMELK